MAEVQKPTEVPAAEAPITEAPAETAAEAPAAETTTAAQTAGEVDPATDTAAAPAEEAKKEEIKPVEEGHLEHKVSNFPKNLVYSKKHVWFGSDAIDNKHLQGLLKSYKVTETAQHVASWASETGRGLLFYGDKNEKSAPQGAIHLGESSEPTTDGPNKFVIASKGHKHTFKAANSAERDNWVAQIKAKIAEAKELAPTVTQSENYKKTIDSYKPAPIAKKEEKPAPATEAAAVEAAPVEAAATEAAVAKDEPAKEEPKRRSASSKRQSFFGGLRAKKPEEKKTEAAAADAEPAAPAETSATAPAETSATAPTETAATEAETPAVPAVEEPAAAETAAPAAAVAEAPKAEEPKTEVKAKRNSIFGGLSFGKRKPSEAGATKETETAAPADEAPIPAPAADAPVIPPVETTLPLSAEVASPANLPVETTEISAPATNGETKKEVKDNKRKSSLPFNFGKREKSTTSGDEEEKPKSSNSPFSKFRATIRGKTTKTEKSSEKTDEKAAEAEAAKEAEPAAEAGESSQTAPAPAVEETNAPENITASTPAVTATA